MGGLGGHMNHLYDNPRLTFDSMMDIMKKAARGELTSVHMQATLAKSEGGPSAYDASGAGAKGQGPGTIIESEG